MTRPIPKIQAVMVRPRVYIGENIALGPGKIDLIRAVGKTRSLSAAARALEIPYKRAWLLIDSLNLGFGVPVVSTAIGGKGGGGTTLTPLFGVERLKALTLRRAGLSSEGGSAYEGTKIGRLLRAKNFEVLLPEQ